MPPGTGSLTHLCATGDRFLDTLTPHSQNVQRIRAIQQIGSVAYFASLLLAKARAGKALMHARAACRWKQSEAKLSKRDCCMPLLFCTFCEWGVSVSRNLSPVAHGCVKEPVPGGTLHCYNDLYTIFGVLHLAGEAVTIHDSLYYRKAEACSLMPLTTAISLNKRIPDGGKQGLI